MLSVVETKDIVVHPEVFVRRICRHQMKDLAKLDRILTVIQLQHINIQNHQIDAQMICCSSLLL